MTLSTAPTLIAAAIGTQSCTRARTIGAAERYQRLVPTVSALDSRFVVVFIIAPFRAGQAFSGRFGRAPTDAGTAKGGSGCAAGLCRLVRSPATTESVAAVPR